jgi:hypothetical protein
MGTTQLQTFVVGLLLVLVLLLQVQQELREHQ